MCIRDSLHAIECAGMLDRAPGVICTGDGFLDVLKIIRIEQNRYLNMCRWLTLKSTTRENYCMPDRECEATGWSSRCARARPASSPMKNSPTRVASSGTPPPESTPPPRSSTPRSSLVPSDRSPMTTSAPSRRAAWPTASVPASRRPAPTSARRPPRRARSSAGSRACRPPAP